MVNPDPWASLFIYREHAARIRQLERTATDVIVVNTYRRIAESYDNLADRSVPSQTAIGVLFKTGLSGKHRHIDV